MFDKQYDEICLPIATHWELEQPENHHALIFSSAVYSQFLFGGATKLGYTMERVMYYKYIYIYIDIYIYIVYSIYIYIHHYIYNDIYIYIYVVYPMYIYIHRLYTSLYIYTYNYVYSIH